MGVKSKIVLILRNEKGEKEKEIVQEGKTIVKNFLAIYEQICKRAISGERASFVDINGTVYDMHDYEYVYTPNRPRIALGGGSTPVSFTDYNLENNITGWQNQEGYEYSYDEANFKGTFTFYKSFTFTSETTINEAGLVWWFRDSGSYSRPVMVDRIVFDTPITVPTNRTLDVKYILEIGKV